KFFKEITKAYRVAFEKAAKRVKNSDGKSGRVKFKAETDYYPFRMKESLPVVKRAVAAVSSIGATPAVRAANGGLDANWMVRHGVPTVTFGAGQNEPHTIDEGINLDEYDRACALALQLATMHCAWRRSAAIIRRRILRVRWPASRAADRPQSSRRRAPAPAA